MASHRHAQRALIVVLVVGLTTIAGCEDDDPTGEAAGAGRAPPESAADLDGRTFVVSAVEGESIVDGTTLTLTFDDGRVAAQAGCNSMTGSFSVESGRLRVGAIAQTRMACDAERERQDAWFAGVLEAAPALTLDGSHLTIASDAVTLTAEER